jgi:hypothetical protein
MASAGGEKFVSCYCTFKVLVRDRKKNLFSFLNVQKPLKLHKTRKKHKERILKYLHLQPGQDVFLFN